MVKHPFSGSPFQFTTTVEGRWTAFDVSARGKRIGGVAHRRPLARHPRRAGLLAAVALSSGASWEGPCTYTAPISPASLYADLQHESPVRGDPGDLLLLAGTHFDLATTVVVYEAIGDTTQPLEAPSTMPAGQSATEGVITPLSRDPNAVTIALPAVMIAGQSYALWAATPDADTYVFSNGVRINDARPMWVSPGPRSDAAQPSYPYAYQTADRPGIGRVVKIVGRNLQHAPDQQTQVRFTAPGESPITLTAADDGDPATQIERYTAEVTLPATMPLVNGQATNYAIAVSRDGVSWVPLDTQLAVLPDPPALTAANAFYPGNYGDAANACSPCDTPADAGSDDTLCITRAIHAAAQYAAQHSATGNVVFQAPACRNGNPATWIVAADCNPGGHGVLDDAYFGAPYPACYNYWGIVVPKGVNLVADQSATTRPTVETEQGYDQPALDQAAALGTCSAEPDVTPCTNDSDCCSQGNAQACVVGAHGGRCEIRDPGRQNLFNLQGNNVVQGLRLHDNYKVSSVLGHPAYATVLTPGGDISFVSSPGVQTLLVAGNDITITDDFFDDSYAGIGPYPTTLQDGLPGNMDLVITRNEFGCYFTGVGLLEAEDSVIAHNTFWPGAYPVPVAGSTRGGRRLEISSNIVDGTISTYSGSYLGWRAGFFFPTFSSQENLLVAGNQLRCIGTRPYADGEAFSTDSHGDRAGLRYGELVAAAPAPTATQVSIPWPASSNLAVSESPSDYKGRWLRIDYGQGLGQARKITDVSPTSTTLTFTVTPPFDVPPAADQSRVIVGNQVWQMNIVDNRIDNTCATKINDLSNLRLTSAGIIEVYSGAVDVAIESNHSIDAVGVSLSSQYFDSTTHDSAGVTHVAYQTPQYFVDIRGNSIEGQFGGPDNPQNTFGSGIELTTISGTLVDGVVQASPNLTGFGVSVSHNTILDTALNDFYGLYQSAGIAIVPQQVGDESASPGYVDTLVFANDITGTPASADNSYSSAISNGSLVSGTMGGPNYPSGTVICGNQYASFATLYTDWPGPGETSSLLSCGP